MKKRLILLSLVMGLAITGCGNNEFAESEYDSVKAIVKSEDRYAKVASVFNPIEGGYSLVVSEFDGRQTLWNDKLKEEKSVEVQCILSLTEGQAKLVHIDEDDNVTTVLECTPESSVDEYVTKTVVMPKGKNRFKIVGYDCENLDVKILFSVDE